MRYFGLGILVCAMLLTACDDDESNSFISQDEDLSSSCVTPKSSSDEASVSSSSLSAESSNSITQGTVDPSTVVKGEMTDNRDDQTYKTVVIGTQTWMAENLNYETANSYCYDGRASNCTEYGRLYTWAAAVGKSEEECGFDQDCNLPSGDVRGVCPEGWHLPDTTEWNTLFQAVGGKSTAGKMLKSQSGWDDRGGGTDDYAFSALPTGFRDYEREYRSEREYASSWSSTEYGSNHAYDMTMGYFYDYAVLDDLDKDAAAPVRCLKDDLSTGPKSNSSKTSVSSSSSAPGTVDPSTVVMGEVTDGRDGQTYKTVVIGTQTWMAENLNYETASSYCYNHIDSNCARYGRVYTWAAAVDKSEEECGYAQDCNLLSGDVRGVCPEGWHLPDTTEWNTLFTAVGGKSTAGKMLKSTSGWKDDRNGTDAYAFLALPVGLMDKYGAFTIEGGSAGFWCSTELGSGDAITMYLYYHDSKANLISYYKYYGFSVRCLKD